MQENNFLEEKKQITGIQKYKLQGYINPSYIIKEMQMTEKYKYKYQI